MTRSSALSLPLPLLLVGLLAAGPAAADVASTVAPWQWRDANGRMVYSDTPPPPPIHGVLQAPGRLAGDYRVAESENTGQDAAARPAASPAPTAARAAPGKPAPTAEEAFEKRREERLQAATKAAEKERTDMERASYCNELRTYAAGLEGGMRVGKASADGTLQHMDSDQRAAEMSRTRATLEKNCA